jgi:hypothetical protein
VVFPDAGALRSGRAMAAVVPVNRVRNSSIPALRGAPR